jgi:hypothetical protein
MGSQQEWRVLAGGVIIPRHPVFRVCVSRGGVVDDSHLSSKGLTALLRQVCTRLMKKSPIMAWLFGIKLRAAAGSKSVKCSARRIGNNGIWINLGRTVAPALDVGFLIPNAPRSKPR